MTETVDGLIWALLVDGEGHGRMIGWDEVESWNPDQGFLWLHLDCKEERVVRWLEERSGIESVVRYALAADETRPRGVVSREGLLVILRTVNLNPGADPEDMVSLRVWLDAGRAITVRQRRVFALQDLRDQFLAGEGPIGPGWFLVELCDLIAARVSDVLEELEDEVDSVEEQILTGESRELRSHIGALRRQAIALHRHLAPQRDALSRLPGERVPWLDDLHRQHLREAADRVIRFVEGLDASRDRAAVTQEELQTRISDQMNRTMYLLSVVAAIFLPLGLLTGLLGINVGGIPGSQSPWGFAVVCGLLGLTAAFLVIYFRLRRMI